jgi:diadenylate cyclase
MLSTILKIATKILDIGIVWLMFYQLLKYSRNNFKLTLIFKGVVILVLLKLASTWLNLNTVGIILEYVISWGPLALIIIFQPEIRNILEHIGRKQLLGRHKILTLDEREKLVYEITNAVDYLRKARMGGLIVIERELSLTQYIERSKILNAEVSSELLISIFFPRNPLHDGGVIIQGNKIASAGVVFPISLNNKINKKLGTRHRAALGISEETDCISLVVSEETGRLSIAIKGELYYNLSLDDVRMMLVDELRPKKELEIDDEMDEEEIYEENR